MSAFITTTESDVLHRVSYASFQSAIDTEDELGMIVRTHITIERIMVTKLKSILPYASVYDIGKFDNAVRLLRAMALCDWGTYNASKCLNYFRDSLAHEAERALSPEEIDAFDVHVRTSMPPKSYSPPATESKLDRLRFLLLGLFMSWLNYNSWPIELIRRKVLEHELASPEPPKPKRRRGKNAMKLKRSDLPLP